MGHMTYGETITAEHSIEAGHHNKVPEQEGNAKCTKLLS
jgi:hypothetical protein